ncbi:stage II sporulation protein M [Sutcliffiella rhizosphaerae]|uniref:Stage II sporulation protein M n=1 Tax=Sutcliffiella rhizosphaerae TaxID=2880967 RepID=A0ABM8YQT6_9BACI|nr:stage II sporulation protein M [Sutcliffiella rhizosphaerae]CAG9622371.1 Stage II sporulation protein M [Sutcliffiella rhizosphaerae]
MKKQSRFTVLLGHLKEHSSLYLFIVVLFFMGVIFGAIVVNSMNFSQKQDLFVYISRFFGQVEEGHIANQKDIFFQSYFHNIKYVLLMWVLGISIIGLPVILVLLFLKGVVVGFTVGFLVNQLSWKGFLLSFVAILPQNMISIPAYIIIGALSVAFTLKMIRQQFVKRIQEPFFQQFIRYSMAMGVILMLLVAASLIEAFASPVFMKSVVSLLD